MTLPTLRSPRRARSRVGPGAIGIAACAIAPAALAGGTLTLKFATAPSWDALWTDDITAAPGDILYVRVLAGVPDEYWGGFRSAKFNITSAPGDWDFGGDDAIDLSPAKGSATDGRLPGFDFGGQSQQVFELGGLLRIDAKGDQGDSPNAGISASNQTPANCDFCDPHWAYIYEFAVLLHSTPIERRISLRIMDGMANGDPNQITSFTAFRGSDVTDFEILQGPTGDTGTISIVPSSGSFVLAAAGAAASRRRRSPAR